MDRAELIVLFLKYGFNVTGEVLDFLLSIPLSDSQLKVILPQLPQEIPVITVPVIQETLTTIKRHISMSKIPEILPTDHPPADTQKTSPNSNQIATPENLQLQVPKISHPLPEIIVSLDIPTSLTDPVVVLL